MKGKGREGRVEKTGRMNTGQEEVERTLKRTIYERKVAVSGEARTDRRQEKRDRRNWWRKESRKSEEGNDNTRCKEKRS